MKDSILIAFVGKTDPIRGQHDGPILHIVRHFHPEKVILLLSAEIGRDEEEYHHNEEAIHLLAPDCQVECVQTGILNVHSYDDFSLTLLITCNQIKEQNPDKKILLDITSGTPQLETAFCMIAMSDPGRYTPVQVSSPEKSASRAPVFNPQKDLVEEWFETNLDNVEGVEPRWHIPQLLNFKRPMVQFQIESLIKNYDYAGAYQLYLDNKDIFSERTGLLLLHAKQRLNLKHKEAEVLAVKLGMKKELYLIGQSNIAKLVDYFNSMQIKQIRGELNDFVLRIEILTWIFGKYILEERMRIKLDEICNVRESKNSKTFFLSKEKSEQKIPGVCQHMDQAFMNRGRGRYEWGRPVNAVSVIEIINYMAKEKGLSKYEDTMKDLDELAELSGEVRNPAAHTIVAITDEMIEESSKGKNSAELCKAIRKNLIRVFEGQSPSEAYEIYDKINMMVKDAMEQ